MLDCRLSPTFMHQSLLLFVLLSSHPFTVNAENATKATVDPDRSQPIHIEADQLIATAENNRSEYKGHVILTQGSLKIHTESMQVEQLPNGESDFLATSTQQLTRFQKYLAQKNQHIQGHAKQVHYANDTITLTHQALVIVDQNNRIEGTRIVIHVINETIEAGSIPNGTPRTQDRVKVVIQPQTDPSP